MTNPKRNTLIRVISVIVDILLLVGIRGGKMKYGEWLETWVENYVRPVEKEKTYRAYKDAIRLRLAPNFGAQEINALDVSEIQRYITGLLEHGNICTGGPLSANSIRLIFSVFRNSLRRAYNLGYAEKYIGDKLELPKAPNTEVACFTESEQKRIENEIAKILLRQTSQHKLNGIIICLHSGLRIGELLALECFGSFEELHRSRLFLHGDRFEYEFTRAARLPKDHRDRGRCGDPCQLYLDRVAGYRNGDLLARRTFEHQRRILEVEEGHDDQYPRQRYDDCGEHFQR